MKFEHCYYETPIVVLCYHAESADMDNPNGEIYGTQYVITIEQNDGTCYSVDIATRDQAQADRQVAKITARGDVPDDYCREAYPTYGSEAWQRLDALGYWRDLEMREDQNY